MKTKLFEIRDEGTFIPVMAFELDYDSEAERYLLACAGYGNTPGHNIRVVVLWKMDGGNGQATSDAYKWASRTMNTAHLHIKEHWDELETGDVIDVEFILGETKSMKMSERLSNL